MSAIRLITAMIQLKQRVTEQPPREELKEALDYFISGTGKRVLLPLARSQQDNT